MGYTEGRLQQATLNLLAGCDIKFSRENRLDIALVKNLPIALIFLPAADIPTFVGEGRVDLAITSRDQVAEHDAQLGTNNESSMIEEIMDLGFGECKLQVQVPENGDITKASQLVGKAVATSFTALSRRFFAGLEGIKSVADLRTKIKYVGGSVEAACALGVADGIVNLIGMFSLFLFIFVFWFLFPLPFPFPFLFSFFFGGVAKGGLVWTGRFLEIVERRGSLCRVRRADASCWPQGHRHRRPEYLCSGEIKEQIKSARGFDHLTYPGCN